MRFVRAFASPLTAELEHVWEQELPFASDAPVIHTLTPLREGGHRRIETVVHELGLAEHFDARHAVTGDCCSPAMHLFQRIEAVPAAELAGDAVGFKRFRPKAGHEIPIFHEVPTTVKGIRALLRAKGPGAVHERVGYWLHFMGVLEDHEMDAAGFKPLPLAVALEFDAMRLARDPSVGSRAEHFKRAVRHRAHLRMARKAQEA